MLYRALSLSLALRPVRRSFNVVGSFSAVGFLLSSLISAGDTPTPTFKVEVVNSNPTNPPQMPKVEFQNHYATGGGGGGNSSPGVGSTAGGSIINLMSDLLRNKQPDINALRKEKQLADFQASLQKYGEHTTAQFFPDLYEKYMQEKNTISLGFVEHQPVAPTSAPQTTVHLAGFPSNVRHTPQAAAQHFANQQAAAAAVVPTPVVSTPAPTPKVDDFLDLDNSQNMAKTAENFATSMATPSPLPNPSESSGGNGLAGLAGSGALLAQAASSAAPAAEAAVAGGGTVATTTSWGTTLGGYAAAAGGAAIAGAPFAAAIVVGGFVGIGISRTYDYFFDQEKYDLGVFPTEEQRSALKAKRAQDNARKAANNAKPNNAPSSSGSPSPKKPDDNKKPRVINQVQRTEAMEKIKENYRYDKQTNLYKLKDNGAPIKCTRTGKDVINVKWDGAHNDIEALNKRFQHMGSLDPVTFEMYKGPEIGRQEL